MEQFKSNLEQYAQIFKNDGITKDQSLQILWYITTTIQTDEKNRLLANDIVDVCNVVYKRKGE